MKKSFLSDAGLLIISAEKPSVSLIILMTRSVRRLEKAIE
jgi:hypothetical protein